MIFWHSGTGNSASVAARLASLLSERTCRIDKDVSSCFDLQDGERVIWVFPIYSWGIPPTVLSFIRSVTLAGEGLRHFMVCTCGDDVGLSHSQWRKEIRRRGWLPVGTWSVQMPNNYVLLPGFDVDAVSVAERKLEQSEERLQTVARGIRHAARVDDVVRGSFPWLKSHVLYPLFVRFLMSPRPFAHTDECVHCGKCAAVCPRRNVRIGQDCCPSWGSDCAMCLACYHVCPKHAVRYGQRTVRKHQYFLPQRQSIR